MTTFVVAVVGSREFPHRHLLSGWMYENLIQPFATVSKSIWIEEEKTGSQSPYKVISGGAYGPDKWAIWQAQHWGLQWEEFPADWKRFGKAAGFQRNTTLAEKADWVVAFWNGKSRGTLDTIKKAHALGKKVTVVFPDGTTRDNNRKLVDDPDGQ